MTMTVVRKQREINKNGIYNSRQIITLVGLNAKIHLCSDFRTARKLQYSITTREVKPHEWELIDGYYNIDMGLLDKEGIMPELLSKQLKKASKNTILERDNKINKPNHFIISSNFRIQQTLVVSKTIFYNCISVSLLVPFFNDAE